jgi:hypothetical protein
MRPSPPVLGDTKEQVRARRAEELEQRQHAITIARLDAAYQSELAKSQPLKMKSKKEALKDNFEEYHAQLLGVDEFVRCELERIEVTFKDDPDALERERLVIEKWRVEHVD